MTSIYNLSKEQKERMISEIKYFFKKERDEDLGDLAAMLILDFFTEKLAKEFYNEGVHDSYKYMSDKIEDIMSIQKY